MKILITLLFIFTNSILFAKTIEANYSITYGSFLDLGIANAKLTYNKNEYEIKIEAKTVGMAKILTNNRTEIYKSTGSFINNRFIPKKFIKIKKNNYKSRIKEYTFDYENKKIIVKTITEGIKKSVNNELKFQKEPFYNEYKDELKFFTKNDLLSLFFNLNELIEFKYKRNYTFSAIGANKKDGKIDLLIPSKNKTNQLNKTMNKEKEKKLIVYINQKIFGSEKGELFLSLNNEGFCSIAILKDVVLFGDIVGKMTDFKIYKG